LDNSDFACRQYALHQHDSIVAEVHKVVRNVCGVVSEDKDSMRTSHWYGHVVQCVDVGADVHVEVIAIILNT